MQHALHWINVESNLASGQQPIYFLERKLLYGDNKRGDSLVSAEIARVGTFWTPQNSLLDPNCEWTVTREGQYARVPVNAYRTEFFGPAGIFQNGLLLGSAVVENFRRRCDEPIEVLHLIMGNDCTPLPGANAYRCYVGFSIQTK